MKWSKRQLKMKLFLFLADMDFLFRLRRKKIPGHMFPKSRLLSSVLEAQKLKDTFDRRPAS